MNLGPCHPTPPPPPPSPPMHPVGHAVFTSNLPNYLRSSRKVGGGGGGTGYFGRGSISYRAARQISTK